MLTNGVIDFGQTWTVLYYWYYGVIEGVARLIVPCLEFPLILEGGIVLLSGLNCHFLSSCCDPFQCYHVGLF